MHSSLWSLIERLSEPALTKAGVIPWSCPVPAFGDVSRSRIATLGLNPSNREFVDECGNELEGISRRLPTLKSLRLTQWSDAEASHLQSIADSCSAYFSRNPYDGWFKKLDYIISGTQSSFYNTRSSACHLDLIPYATSCKWTELSSQQRSSLLKMAGDTFGQLLQGSSIEFLILNGNSVVSRFQEVAGVRLEKKAMDNWSLPRRSENVRGFAFKGTIRQIGEIRLKREIYVLGFNHNIQSSFGVTKEVTTAIRTWVAKSVEGVFF